MCLDPNSRLNQRGPYTKGQGWGSFGKRQWGNLILPNSLREWQDQLRICKQRLYKQLLHLKHVRHFKVRVVAGWGDKERHWLTLVFTVHLASGFKRAFPDRSVGKESACNAGDPVRSLGWEDPLEKGKAMHSSILAWRTPWTVLSMGSQRVRHDWMTFTSLRV